MGKGVFGRSIERDNSSVHAARNYCRNFGSGKSLEKYAEESGAEMDEVLTIMDNIGGMPSTPDEAREALRRLEKY